MKKIVYIILFICGFGIVNSCVDDFDEINMNPNKIYQVSPQHVFPGVIHNTLNYTAELNHKFYSWHARYVCLWPSPKDTEDMSGIYRDIYMRIVKELEKLAGIFVDDPDNKNAGCMIMTWKAYVYSLLVASFGGVPMSEAATEQLDNVYMYDSEYDMYVQILNLLEKAVSDFDLNGDKLEFDPLFRSADNSSDIVRWRKFANTLYLDIALRVQNMDENLAKEHIKKSLSHNDWFISSVNDIVKMKWGTDLNQDASYYYRSFLRRYEDGSDRNTSAYPRINQYFFLYLKSYEDPRMDAFGTRLSSANRFQVLNDTITRINPYDKSMRDSIDVRYLVPFLPAREVRTVPKGWMVGIDPNSPDGNQQYKDPYTSVSEDAWMFIQRDFIKIDAASVILGWADACFMKAEVAVKYPDLITGSAQQYYEDGIRASFAEYNISGLADNYMKTAGIKWNTNGKGRMEYRGFYTANINGEGGAENHLEQIYKQRYIADFFNGFAGWTLERRTRVLNFPPFFYNEDVLNLGSTGIGDFIPERLLYPRDEITYNPVGYYAAIEEMQATSPSPNPARWGDNFFTLLRIAKPNPQNINDWNSGVVVFNAQFLQKWYGKTEEEFVINASKDYPTIVSVPSLARYAGYRVNTIISTYTPN
ncbi:MAG: SusD/RagB family nutrient-binding outer membrane lipoprotein [Dysgonamonadaceae bacterium]|jgi:hypothetical protein|nr:SusD/RagB family nutrient-binding outer membrane lipoprotein [Dysgonamonadaceae bacterium]